MTASTTNFEQRDFVIRELIDTETNYLEVLNALRYKFMLPMESLLSRDEFRSIFPKIKVGLISFGYWCDHFICFVFLCGFQELAEIHERFLEKIKDAISPMPKYKFSQVFLEFREPFLIYGEYCSNMTNAAETLRDVAKKNPSFEQTMQVSVSNGFYIKHHRLSSVCLSKCLIVCLFVGM